MKQAIALIAAFCMVAMAQEKGKPAPAAPKGPCDLKKIGKKQGSVCMKCEKYLEAEDLRGGNRCKKCDEPAKKVDVCIKQSYRAECHKEKMSDKPIS